MQNKMESVKGAVTENLLRPNLAVRAHAQFKKSNHEALVQSCWEWQVTTVRTFWPYFLSPTTVETLTRTICSSIN